MATAFLPDLRLHYLDEGAPHGPALLLTHPLGLDLRIWDDVVPLLPAGLRVIRYDMRGHGRSDTPAPPYTMGALIRDAERLLDHLALREVVILGYGMGGLVAQGLAVKRLDQIRAMILSNTAAKLGTEAQWRAKSALLSDGIAAYTASEIPRLFARRHADSAAAILWRHHMLHARPDGIAGCIAAQNGTDFYTPTAALTLPTLILASGEDAITPADLMRETGELIAGSQFHLIRSAGHLACVEKPADYAKALSDFLISIAHI